MLCFKKHKNVCLLRPGDLPSTIAQPVYQAQPNSYQSSDLSASATHHAPDHHSPHTQSILAHICSRLATRAYSLVLAHRVEGRRRSSEAAELAAAEAKGVAAHTVSIGADATADMLVAPVLGPDEGHVECAWS